MALVRDGKHVEKIDSSDVFGGFGEILARITNEPTLCFIEHSQILTNHTDFFQIF